MAKLGWIKLRKITLVFATAEVLVQRLGPTLPGRQAEACSTHKFVPDMMIFFFALCHWHGDHGDQGQNAPHYVKRPQGKGAVCLQCFWTIGTVKGGCHHTKGCPEAGETAPPLIPKTVGSGLGLGLLIGSGWPQEQVHHILVLLCVHVCP